MLFLCVILIIIILIIIRLSRSHNGNIQTVFIFSCLSNASFFVFLTNVHMIPRDIYKKKKKEKKFCTIPVILRIPYIELETSLIFTSS